MAGEFCPQFGAARTGALRFSGGSSRSHLDNGSRMTESGRDTAPPGRGGMVCLVRGSTGFVMPGAEDMPWTGYRERGHPPGVLAQGAWDSAAAAIEWARSRCDAVVLRVDVPGRQFSAGHAQPWDERLPDWPPDDAGKFDP